MGHINLLMDENRLKSLPIDRAKFPIVASQLKE